MPADRSLGDFIIRLLVPTIMMAAALWYLGSLWDARMRDKNLILIEPVVIAMIPFYFWVIAFEVMKYRAAEAPGPRAALPAKVDHLKFMLISVATVPLFYLFGAVPASIIGLGVGLFVLGIRRMVLLVAVPIVLTLVLWLVFVELFGIRMPLFLLPW